MCASLKFKIKPAHPIILVAYRSGKHHLHAPTARAAPANKTYKMLHSKEKVRKPSRGSLTKQESSSIEPAVD